MTGEDIISGEMTRERPVRNVNINRGPFLKNPRKNTVRVKDGNKVLQEEERYYGQELSRNTSRSIWSYFVELLMELRRLQEVSSYSVFTLEPLHSQYFGISKSVKKRTMTYFSQTGLEQERASGKTVVC